MTELEKKLDENITNKAENLRNSIAEEREKNGGLIIPKSYCCNAKIGYTSGGIVSEYCTNCNKYIREVLYK